MAEKRNNTLPSNIKPETLTPELLGQFFQNQAKEIELRQNELNLKKQEDDHNFEFAKSALQVKATDRDAEREHDRETQKNRFIFITIVILVIASLTGYALAIGKENFAMEIIKAVIFIIGGGAGGFAIGKSGDGGKARKNPKREELD
jgi:hypothetical protein